MANLQRLLRRQPELDVDPELEARVRARLASIHDPVAASSVDYLAEPDDAPEAGDSTDTGGGDEPVRDGDEPVGHGDETGGNGDEPVGPAGSGDPEVDLREPINVPIWSAAAGSVELDPAASVTGVDALEVVAEVVIAAPPNAKVDRRGGAPRSAKRRPGTASAVVSCPYCASVLQPPPAASRRCPRCRQRIVVKRLADRAVYLTEAALPVFQAERRRLANAGRWTRQRDRWIDLALRAGAPADRVARLVREPVAEGVVAAARALYVSTVERSVRTARRDRHWEKAARIRFGYALALYRLAASPIPPPQEIVRLHQDGLDAALRGIGEIAKSAELRAGTCCEACRADDGQMARIAGELRSPRLPHPDCPKGLCRCRWFLAESDREIVTTLLKRKGRPHRHKADTPASSD